MNYFPLPCIYRKNRTGDRVCRRLMATLFGLFLVPGLARPCSLSFTSPARGSTVTTQTVGVSGTGSGTAKPNDIGQVTATVNGRVFFQQSGVFTTLINFLGSGAASVGLDAGENVLSVEGSVSGCSASDSMTIHYLPPPGQDQKAAGVPGDCNGTNPINGGNGNKFQEEVDYLGGGPQPLEFSRYYNSRFGERRMLGPRWRHSYDRQLAFSGTSVAYAVRGDGRAFRFVLSGAEWKPDGDIIVRLGQNLGGNGTLLGWRLTLEDDSTELYDRNGRLTSIVSRSGWAHDLAYDSAGRITAVIDRVSGRRLTLTYQGDGRLSALIDPAGNSIRYAYDTLGRLSAVSYPNTTPAEPADDPTRTYQYEDSRFPLALTGITDENGVRYARFAYDPQGRGVLSEHAGGVDRHEVIYNPNGSTTVLDALGSARTYSYQTVQGVPVSNQQSQPAGSGCPASARQTEFDGNGNVISRTDFNGNLTRFAFDQVRNLEIRRTEADGTPDSRTITTDWHADFRLPLRIDETGRRTLFSYDAVGNMLRQELVDTIAGSLRTWQFTYDSQGQILTADGPRTDVADITRYRYYDDTDATHAPGDLAQITDALGHNSTFAAFDAHGRPISIIDANSRVLQLRYDERGRLIESNDAGEVTRYGYDKAGLLVRITEPDGNFLAQAYDTAHRLTDVADSLGNRIHFSLDVAGNRLREDITDPHSNLARTQARVFDPLNRLQRLIGAR